MRTVCCFCIPVLVPQVLRELQPPPLPFGANQEVVVQLATPVRLEEEGSLNDLHPHFLRGADHQSPERRVVEIRRKSKNLPIIYDYDHVKDWGCMRPWKISVGQTNFSLRNIGRGS